MKRPKLQWYSRPTLGGGIGPAAAAGPPPKWPGDPTLSSRDEFIFLLHTASEVEHALMAQYLYATWSVGYRGAPVPGPAWAAQIMQVARQEMGHLITIQNILRSMHAPLSLDRDDYPFRSELYPFEFTLERLSLHSLAKYVLAEMPANPTFPAGLTEAEVRAAAQMDGMPAKVNRVGELFERLLAMVAPSSSELSDADFHPDSLPMQARAADWTVNEDEPDQDVIVMTVASMADARAALQAIADQGEGLASPQPGAPPSHFDIFAGLFLSRRNAASDPAATVPVNPNTSPQPTEPGPDEWAAGRILDPKSRQWAMLGNVHYRILLTCIRHALSLKNGDAAEAEVRDHAFVEMRQVGRMGGLLATLPQVDPAAAARAGMPLEMPYSLDFPDTPPGIWLLHRDLLRSSKKLSAALQGMAGLSAGETALLTSIGQSTTNFLAQVEAHLKELLPRPAPVTGIHTLRILPAIAIARFGSSATPLENYDLGPAATDGWHPIVPADTLIVDPATGRITGAEVPAEVKFRDAAGLIKPVCPFLEVWAQFTPDGPLQPLTTTHLEQLGLSTASLRWQVRAANLKAQRRTGDANDGIHADTGAFSDHAVHSLQGTCVNFKAGKAIPFGSVRYLEPTPEFPEIRLRFTPAAGKVFGPNAVDKPIIADDVYDAARGRWLDHIDGLTDRPPYTEPGSIFFGRNELVDFDGDGNPDDFNDDGRPDPLWRSNAYLDDTCDGIISVEIDHGGQTFRAAGRIASGPPHFSPDTLPVRTVADELEQWIHGPEISGPLTTAEAEALGQRAADIIRRALGTVRLMNTAAMNVNGMSGHDQRYRPNEPIFPVASAAYARIENIHSGVTRALAGLSAPPDSQARAQAVGALKAMADILRTYDQVGDLTVEGRRRMPAMMRNADGLHLALTRRQHATVTKAAEMLGGVPGPGPGPTDPQAAMIALIEIFDEEGAAVRHDGVAAGAGTLDSLFSNPPALLSYLRTENVKNNAGQAGRPLVVPGDPDNSAFVTLIESAIPAMRNKFAAPQPTLGGRTGVQIVRAWISSLPTGPVG